MRLGLYIPPFDELADPALVAQLCEEAEEAGGDGAFVWDQLRWREPVAAVGDPQIILAAIAGATERIRLGPMVTPLARRLTRQPVPPGASSRSRGIRCRSTRSVV